VALREILTFPDPRLAMKATPVDVVDDEIRQLIDDMFETMYEAEGVGLAAPQIGVLKRVVVVDCGAREKDEDRVGPLPPAEPVAVVNPVIETHSGRMTWEEGCLSVPGYYDDVERASHVVITGLDRNGEPLRIEAEQSLLGVCLQHEIDHLEGTLFLDHLSRLKQSVVKKRLRKRALDEAAV
jgi:peptide deformylase